MNEARKKLEKSKKRTEKEQRKEDNMETIIFRKGWLVAANKLTDAQYREFINKVAAYGFNECAEDVTSKDELVNVMLEMVKPNVRECVSKYLNY